MKNRSFSRYYLLAFLLLLAASYYPLSMGVRVLADMLRDGTVLKENYPKYIIPYTPISIALLIGMLAMPLCFRLFGKRAQLGGSVLSVGTFFALETLLERWVVVTTTETVATLADWQMFMCAYIPPEDYAGEEVVRTYTETAADILMGNYNPAFKLHFYLISAVLILAVLNCLYGFGRMIRTGDNRRKKALILQSGTAAVFLGLCILACFTAFWRDGSLRVSPLSAVLMAVFFILLGMVAGIFAASLGAGHRLAGLVSAAMTAAMYAGEAILLHAELYRFGEGLLFTGLPGIVLAPVDIVIIALSGLLTGWACKKLA